MANERADQAGNRDIAYYDENAREYAEATLGIDFSNIYARFLQYVRPGGLILDVGSGSGRDTLAFLRRGFLVEAIEPSAQLAWLSLLLTGVQPRPQRVQDIEDQGRFDGVWACASLVHVAAEELLGAVQRLGRAARVQAPIYLSFKYGNSSRISSDGRPYIDMSEKEIEQLVCDIPDLRVVEMWLSEGEGVAYGRDKWINVILKRISVSESA